MCQNEGRWMGMPWPQPYLTLFNASSRAVKSVDPSFRIGGPASADLAHVQDFVQAATALKIPFGRYLSSRGKLGAHK